MAASGDPPRVVPPPASGAQQHEWTWSIKPKGCGGDDPDGAPDRRTAADRSSVLECPCAAGVGRVRAQLAQRARRPGRSDEASCRPEGDGWPYRVRWADAAPW